MGEIQILLTAEERAFLEEHLSATMKHLKVEEHRTRTPTFRELVTHDKDVLAGILIKLAEAPAQRTTPVGAAP